MLKKIFLVVFCLTIFFSCKPEDNIENYTSKINGKITRVKTIGIHDVSNVEVVLVRSSDNKHYQATSDINGKFSFVFLKNGTYLITLKKTGFGFEPNNQKIKIFDQIKEISFKQFLKVKLAAIEMPPYIGKNLLNQGYVAEVAKEAFKRSGYKVEFEFLPLLRAINMTKMAKVDGVLPLFYDETLELYFSDPFPGKKIVLLKRKSQEIQTSFKAKHQKLERIINDISYYKFGYVKGSNYLKDFDTSQILTKEASISNIDNIKKLYKGRIDLTLIDKNIAANLMINKAPYMIGKLNYVEKFSVNKDFQVAFSTEKRNAGVLEKVFNNGLKQLRKEKIISKLLYKHGLKDKDSKIRKKQTSLRIATVDNRDMYIMQKLSREYEKKNPHIKIQWNVLDESVLRTRLLTDITLAEGKYDIMTIGAYETPIWAKKNYLSVIEKIPQKYEVNDILKSVRDSLTHNKKLYALPFYAESSVLFYRKDLFEKAGLIMPDNPTYEQILNFSEKLHDPKNKIYALGLRGKPAWGENIAFISTLVNTFGGRWFDKDWYPAINSNEWREAIALYVELMNKYGPPGGENNGFSENLDLFKNGNLAMWIDATVAAGSLYNPGLSKIANTVGIVNAPVAKTKKGSHWLWVWSFAIPVSSTRQHEALKFILWATSKNYIKLVAKKEGWISVPPGTRVSTYQNKEYSKAAPFSKFVLNAIQNADVKDPTLKPVPYQGIQYVAIPEFPAIGEQVAENIVNIINGKSTIKEALERSQLKVKHIVKEAGYIK